MQAQDLLIHYFLLDSSGYFRRLSARRVSGVGDTYSATFITRLVQKHSYQDPNLQNSQYKRRNRVLCQDNELRLLFTSEWKTAFLTERSDTRRVGAASAPFTLGNNGAFVCGCKSRCQSQALGLRQLNDHLHTLWLFPVPLRTEICKETEPPPWALLSPTADRILLTHKCTFPNLANLP